MVEYSCANFFLVVLLSFLFNMLLLKGHKYVHAKSCVHNAYRSLIPTKTFLFANPNHWKWHLFRPTLKSLQNFIGGSWCNALAYPVRYGYGLYVCKIWGTNNEFFLQNNPNQFCLQNLCSNLPQLTHRVCCTITNQKSGFRLGGMTIWLKQPLQGV